ncbi:hypothetical protein CBR_g39404 [Chara braunii]|uniref:Uncharacterized protein n=1 Tax=Chara braunii TaxID=69332 RepID=A0A388LRP8_CHABU|nr:hypothetical protein CBR_g39404 [Chara braunii]|eukprot:GBG84941.1 hypothetical protein CBR_g39404 [Chara braunii]
MIRRLTIRAGMMLTFIRLISLAILLTCYWWIAASCASSMHNQFQGHAPGTERGNRTGPPRTPHGRGPRLGPVLTRATVLAERWIDESRNNGHGYLSIFAGRQRLFSSYPLNPEGWINRSTSDSHCKATGYRGKKGDKCVRRGGHGGEISQARSDEPGHREEIVRRSTSMRGQSVPPAPRPSENNLLVAQSGGKKLLAHRVQPGGEISTADVSGHHKDIIRQLTSRRGERARPPPEPGGNNLLVVQSGDAKTIYASPRSYGGYNWNTHLYGSSSGERTASGGSQGSYGGHLRPSPSNMGKTSGTPHRSGGHVLHSFLSSGRTDIGSPWSYGEHIRSLSSKVGRTATNLRSCKRRLQTVLHQAAKYGGHNSSFLLRGKETYGRRGKYSGLRQISQSSAQRTNGSLRRDGGYGGYGELVQLSLLRRRVGEEEEDHNSGLAHVWRLRGDREYDSAQRYGRERRLSSLLRREKSEAKGDGEEDGEGEDHRWISTRDTFVSMSKAGKPMGNRGTPRSAEDLRLFQQQIAIRAFIDSLFVDDDVARLSAEEEMQVTTSAVTAEEGETQIFEEFEAVAEEGGGGGGRERLDREGEVKESKLEALLQSGFDQSGERLSVTSATWDFVPRGGVGGGERLDRDEEEEESKLKLEALSQNKLDKSDEEFSAMSTGRQSIPRRREGGEGRDGGGGGGGERLYRKEEEGRNKLELETLSHIGFDGSSGRFSATSTTWQPLPRVVDWWKINTEYSDDGGHHVTSRVTRGSEVFDSYSHGLQLNGDDIVSIVGRAMNDASSPSTSSLPVSSKAIYFVITSDNVIVSGHCTELCAYHDIFLRRAQRNFVYEDRKERCKDKEEDKRSEDKKNKRCNNRKSKKSEEEKNKRLKDKKDKRSEEQMNKISWKKNDKILEDKKDKTVKGEGLDSTSDGKFLLRSVGKTRVGRSRPQPREQLLLFSKKSLSSNWITNQDGGQDQAQVVEEDERKCLKRLHQQKNEKKEESEKERENPKQILGKAKQSQEKNKKINCHVEGQTHQRVGNIIGKGQQEHTEQKQQSHELRGVKLRKQQMKQKDKKKRKGEDEGGKWKEERSKEEEEEGSNKKEKNKKEKEGGKNKEGEEEKYEEEDGEVMLKRKQQHRRENKYRLREVQQKEDGRWVESYQEQEEEEGVDDHVGMVIKYVFLGNPIRCPEVCTSFNSDTITPNGHIAIDGAVSILAHELIESTNDPEHNAWYNSQGFESADLCAWTFGHNEKFMRTGELYNMIGVDGRRFYAQQNYRLPDRGCSTTT